MQGHCQKSGFEQAKERPELPEPCPKGVRLHEEKKSGQEQYDNNSKAKVNTSLPSRNKFHTRLKYGNSFCGVQVQSDRRQCILEFSK
jgi:hypothetical protein